MISLLLVCLFPTPMMVTGFAFVIGFAAAGGVLQLGATIMAMSFPNGKGKATGIFYTAGSIASFTIPLITAKLSQISIASIMWFDFLIAVIGFVIEARRKTASCRSGSPESVSAQPNSALSSSSPLCAMRTAQPAVFPSANSSAAESAILRRSFSVSFIGSVLVSCIFVPIFYHIALDISIIYIFSLICSYKNLHRLWKTYCILKSSVI